MGPGGSQEAARTQLRTPGDRPAGTYHFVLDAVIIDAGRRHVRSDLRGAARRDTPLATWTEHYEPIGRRRLRRAAVRVRRSLRRRSTSRPATSSCSATPAANGASVGVVHPERRRRVRRRAGSRTSRCRSSCQSRESRGRRRTSRRATTRPTTASTSVPAPTAIAASDVPSPALERLEAQRQQRHRAAHEVRHGGRDGRAQVRAEQLGRGRHEHRPVAGRRTAERAQRVEHGAATCRRP